MYQSTITRFLAVERAKGYRKVSCTFYFFEIFLLYFKKGIVLIIDPLVGISNFLKISHEVAMDFIFTKRAIDPLVADLIQRNAFFTAQTFIPIPDDETVRFHLHSNLTF